jgi:flagellar motility protein MotE (MotC chaperone)
MIGVAIRFLRDLRLVPIVLSAIIALFTLKALGLALDGGYLFDPSGGGEEITGTVPGSARMPAPKPAPKQSPKPLPKPSWSQDMFNFPGGPSVATPAPPPPRPSSPPSLDITGAVGAAPVPASEEKPAEAPAKKPAPQEPPPPGVNGTAVPLDLDHPVSPAERAILESLQKRRTELDARARELDMREDLVKAAERRLEGRIAELKDLESHIDAELGQKDEAEAARFKNVVTMYENMKAKDAAKIFDGLDIKVLLDVAKAINPRRMSDILALMQPDNAQRLTIELATHSNAPEQPQTADLPKIQGRPTPN